MAVEGGIIDLSRHHSSRSRVLITITVELMVGIMMVAAKNTITRITIQ